jgi:hypothetical protein
MPSGVGEIGSLNCNETTVTSKGGSFKMEEEVEKVRPIPFEVYMQTEIDKLRLRNESLENKQISLEQINEKALEENRNLISRCRQYATVIEVLIGEKEVLAAQKI